MNRTRIKKRFGSDSIKLRAQVHQFYLFKDHSFKTIHENPVFDMGTHSA